MRYLITGCTGFVGKSLVERLKCAEVLCVGREWSSDKSIPQKIREFDPNYIIHCAAEIKTAANMYESNIQMTSWLLEATRDLDYRSFIYVGSSSEYGAVTGPANEQTPLKPRNMYEGTKAAGSMLCLGYANQYNKPIAVVRPFSVYGVYEPHARLIPTLFRCVKTNTIPTISVGVHDFIHIDDFLDGLLSVTHSEKELIKADVVHFGSGIQHSNVEVFEVIKEITGVVLEYSPISNIFNKYDSLSWVADITYAKYKYKFNPKYTLKTGLKQVYESNYR